MRFSFLILCLLSAVFVSAQISIDSLERSWQNAETPEKQRLEDLVHNGLLYLEKGQYYDAGQYFEKLIDFETGRNNPKYRSIYSLNQSWGLPDRDTNKIDLLRESIQLALSVDYRYGMSLASTYTGLYYRRKNELDSAVFYWNKAIHHALDTDDSHLILNKGWTEIQLAMLMIQTGNPEQAKNYEDEAMQSFWSIPDEAGAYFGYYELGMVHQQIGQYTKALEYFKKALPLMPEGNPYIHLEMAFIYEAQGDWKKAAEYYQYSTDQLLNLNKRGIAYRNLASLGRMYVKIDDINKAESIAESLVADLDREQPAAPEYKVYTLLGDIELYHKNLDQAIRHFQTSLDLQSKAGISDSSWVQNNQLNLSRALLEQGRYSKAVEYCLECEKHTMAGVDYSEQETLYNLLYEAYKKLGNNEKALAYLEKIVDIYGNQNPIELARQLQKFEFSKQMLEDSLKQAEKNLAMEIEYQTELRRKSKTENMLYVLGGFLSLIAIGLFSRLRYVRKTKDELQKKSLIIEQEKEKAKASEKAKHLFLANMSHEIRTPMNAIMGMSDILIRRKPKADQIKYLNAIKESSDSLLVIINDILDLSKIEEGKVELEYIPFSMKDIIKNIHTVLRFKTEEKGLELKSNIPTGVPYVLGDPTRLRQIIINLVGNAIKFTEKGVVTTSLQLETHDNATKVNAHFIVSDTGIGIEDEKLEQIFNSFEQAYADTSRTFGGTGLGLSICKKLIELQDGRIWVESKKGAGSRFHFIIPYEVCTRNENAPVDSTASNIETLSNLLKGVRILLAEDNAFNAVVAQEELEDTIEEVKFVVAENGAIAVEEIRHKDFDIVLMDVQMPVMNGYEATRSIRDLENDKSKIPIIAMTANVMKEEVKQCYDAGMNDFIGKPFDTNELIQKIYKYTKT